MKLVGRDSVEAEECVDLIMQTNLRCQRSSRYVIPSREDDEGPHNRGLTLKELVCSYACWRGPSLALGMTAKKQTRSPRCQSERVELIPLIVGLNYPYGGSTVTVAFRVAVTSPASIRPLVFTS